MTVRQAFYALEMAGIVAKTEQGYVQVQRQVLAMRKQGALSWDFITDGTRWQRKPTTYLDATDYLDTVSRAYRRDLWQSASVRIEIWLEKDALADVIYDVTERWDVSLMVSRGQSSATFLHAAAVDAQQAYEEAEITTFIYTLFDYDAGGDRAANAVARDLHTYAPTTPITVERLAVTAEQVEQWNLPTRPAKRSDPQAAVWGNKPAVELDAIDPITLRNLAQDAILRHIDPHGWKVEREIERSERQGLLALAASYRPNVP